MGPPTRQTAWQRTGCVGRAPNGTPVVLHEGVDRICIPLPSSSQYRLDPVAADYRFSIAGYLPMPPESMFSLTCLLAVLDAFGLDAKGGLLLFAIVCRVCEHDQNYDHLSHHRNISK